MSTCRRLTEDIPVPFAVAPLKRRTCIELLAEGFTGCVDDLCGHCTARFMTGMERECGPLKWHPGYAERAGQAVTS